MSEHKEIDIDRVGIKGLTYPIVLRDRQNESQRTVATIDFSVDLPRKLRGTHMSRFMEVLNHFRGEIDLKNMEEILEHAKKRLDAVSAHIKVSFPYFISKYAPISKSPGIMDYRCTIEASSRTGASHVARLTVQVPVTAVCPCSKAHSDRGAHNQRSIITVTAQINRFVWLEELIEVAERSGSHEVYSHLKQEDEKYITETAYDNPSFVEDIVRNVAHQLRTDDRIDWFLVEVENFESIHNHNAYAMIQTDLRQERRTASDHSTSSEPVERGRRQ